eukprot:4820062-Heterocapsa_arctica.AAC.1
MSKIASSGPSARGVCVAADVDAAGAGGGELADACSPGVGLADSPSEEVLTRLRRDGESSPDWELHGGDSGESGVSTSR